MINRPRMQFKSIFHFFFYTRSSSHFYFNKLEAPPARGISRERWFSIFFLFQLLLLSRPNWISPFFFFFFKSFILLSVYNCIIHVHNLTCRCQMQLPTKVYLWFHPSNALFLAFILCLFFSRKYLHFEHDTKDTILVPEKYAQFSDCY